MKQIKYFVLFILFTCKVNMNKSENERDTHFNTNSKKNKNTIQKKKDTIIDIKGKTILFFNERDSLPIVTNFYTVKKIDSVSSYKKEFKAKYDNCGKGRNNIKLFNSIKNKNLKDYNSLKNITTAHNLIINKDTLYLNGRKGIKCYKPKDSVNVKCTIYKINIENNCLNMIIIDDLKIIK